MAVAGYTFLSIGLWWIVTFFLMLSLLSTINKLFSTRRPLVKATFHKATATKDLWDWTRKWSAGDWLTMLFWWDCLLWWVSFIVGLPGLGWTHKPFLRPSFACLCTARQTIAGRRIWEMWLSTLWLCWFICIRHSIRLMRVQTLLWGTLPIIWDRLSSWRETPLPKLAFFLVSYEWVSSLSFLFGRCRLCTTSCRVYFCLLLIGFC